MLLAKIQHIKDQAKSCEKAADAILKEFKNLYLNEEGILPFLDIEEINTSEDSTEKNNKIIYEKTKIFLEKAEKCTALGCNNSITFPCFEAFAKKFDNPGLVVFDAHPNCMIDPESTNKSYLKALIENNILKKENVILIGLRSWHRDEYKFLKDNKIKVFAMKEISSEQLQEISDSVMSVAKNFGALYISIDIDAVDPAAAPGTNDTEPGGLTSRELLFLLSKLKLLKNLKFIDLVNIEPEKDLNNLTVKLGAKIISEMC